MILRSPLEPPRPRGRWRFLLIGVPLLAVFAAFGWIVWLADVDSAPGYAIDELPLIKADAGPLKSWPDDSGGNRVVADQGDAAPPPGPFVPRPKPPITSLAEAEPGPAEPPAPAGSSSASAGGDAAGAVDGGSSAIGAAASEQVQTAPRELVAVPPRETQPAPPEIAGGVQIYAGGGMQAGDAAEDDPKATLDALLAEVTGRADVAPLRSAQPAEAARGRQTGQPARSAEPDPAEPPALAGSSSGDGSDVGDDEAAGAVGGSSSAARATGSEEVPPAPLELAAAPPREARAPAPSTAGGVSADDGEARQARDALQDDPEAALDTLIAELKRRTEAALPSSGQPAEPAPGQPTGQPAAVAERDPAAQPVSRPAEADVRAAISAPAPRPIPPAPPRPARAEREQAQIAAIAPGVPVPALRESSPNAIRPAPQQPRQQSARPNRQSVPAEPAPTQVAGVGPSYRIQLAAVPEESEARRAWDLLRLDLGDVLTGVDPIIERAEVATGVLYRVQAGPLASAASAERLCERVKQRNASCFVVQR